MNLLKLPFRDAKRLAERRLNNVVGIIDDVIVRMHGVDLGDHYLILEDRRDSDENGHNKSCFLFYFSDAKDDDLPFEAFEYNTMVEAALYYAYRFVLDNCDGADSSNERISALHSERQQALSKLIDASTKRH